MHIFKPFVFGVAWILKRVNLKMVITGARVKADILEAVQFIQDELAVATVEDFY